MKRIRLKNLKNISCTTLTAVLAMLAAAVLTSPLTVHAAGESYNLYIGSTQVTSDNADNILGETGADGKPTAWYEADTKTLHLNGVHVGEDDFSEGSEYDGRYSMYAGADEVLNLVITGENTFTARGEWEEQPDPWSLYYLYAGIYFNTSDGNTFRITGNGSLRSEAYGMGYVDEESLEEVEEGDPESLERGYGMYLAGGNCVNEIGSETDSESGPKLFLSGNDSGMYVESERGVYMNSGTLVGVSTISRKNDSANGNGIAIQYNNGGHAAVHVKGGLVAAYSAVTRSISEVDYRFYPSIEEITAPEGWEIYGKEGAAKIGLFELGIDPTDEEYQENPGTDIDVLGYTENATVYSVDVEWGAMTFQWENSTWDATVHQNMTGAGWKVYDSEKKKALASTTDSINQIQVTNHSNAEIWATLAYAGMTGYEDTAGGFEKKADDTITDFDTSNDSLHLDTADNGEAEDGSGVPTVGTVYFMPDGIKEESKTNGITKWTQLGTITVGVKTQAP